MATMYQCSQIKNAVVIGTQAWYHKEKGLALIQGKTFWHIFTSVTFITTNLPFVTEAIGMFFNMNLFNQHQPFFFIRLGLFCSYSQVFFFFRVPLAKDLGADSGLLDGEFGSFSCVVLCHFWSVGLATFWPDSLKDDTRRVWPRQSLSSELKATLT